MLRARERKSSAKESETVRSTEKAYERNGRTREPRESSPMRSLGEGAREKGETSVAPNLEYTAAALQICRRIIARLSHKWHSGRAARRRPARGRGERKEKNTKCAHKVRLCDTRERNLAVAVSQPSLSQTDVSREAATATATAAAAYRKVSRPCVAG